MYMLPYRFQWINYYPCDPDFLTSRRVFDYHYLLYVHSGRGSFAIGPTTHAASAGDLFYCPPGVGNTIHADDQSPFVLSGIEFHADSLQPVSGLPERTNLAARPFWASAIRQMIDQYELGLGQPEGPCAYLLGALIEELRLHGGERATAMDILQYLRENIERNVTHQELSEVFFYHKNTINTLLRRATGKSLKAYQTELKMQRAVSLLRYSDRSVAEIAGLCGYSNPSFFARQFARELGTTPLKYRNGEPLPKI